MSTLSKVLRLESYKLRKKIEYRSMVKRCHLLIKSFIPEHSKTNTYTSKVVWSSHVNYLVAKRGGSLLCSFAFLAF